MSDLVQEVQNNNWKTKLRDEMITILTGDTQAQQSAYWQIGFHYNCSDFYFP